MKLKAVLFTFLYLFLYILPLYAGNIYKLGLSLAITGPTSDAGFPYSKGVEDYFRYVNDNKLLGDDIIQCMIRDDQYKKPLTIRNFEEFLKEKIVLYLNYSTGSTLILKKAFEEVKIPVIPASFHAGNLINSNYIFLPIASYSEQALGLAEYIANNFKESKANLAMFIHPSAFGRGPVEDVRKAVKKGLNVNIIEIVEHRKDLDVTAMLKRWKDKKINFVICQTVQSYVARLLKEAWRLEMAASVFGENKKITFMGAHYTGGNDLIKLAGSAAENFFWTTSYTLTSEKDVNTKAQLELAKKYKRSDKTAHSHNYTNGIMVAQIATEVIRRAKARGLEVNRKNLYDILNNMNGYNAFYSIATVGPITFSKNDRAGVDTLQIYTVQDSIFKPKGNPFVSEYIKKIYKAY